MQVFIHKGFVTLSTVISISTRNHYHCSNYPADIDGVASFLNVHLRVFQGFSGVVQDFKTDVHHIVLKLRERITEEMGVNMKQLSNCSILHL